MTSKLQDFAKWGSLLAGIYVVVFYIEVYIVFPVEKKYLTLLPEIASVIFLPHAVRVLSTVIIGPKTFFALFPTLLAIDCLRTSPETVDGFFLIFFASIAGAACAPIAYLIVKGGNKYVRNRELDLYDWRTVLKIGVAASIINSIMRAVIYSEFSGVQWLAKLILQTIVGDIVGLMVGLVILVFIFRLINRGRLPSGD